MAPGSAAEAHLPSDLTRTGASPDRSRRRGYRGALIAVALFAGTQCGGGDATFARQFAPQFAAGGHSVSVFGVYKDGQMSAGAWDGIESRIAPSFGVSHCAAGYSDALGSTHGALSAALEDYARANGPTDDLLVQIAPAAQGDLILVLTVAGKLPPKATPQAHQSAPAIGAGGGGRGGGGMPSPSPYRGPIAPGSTDELDLSASLYSVHERRSVGELAMRYSGTSVDDAVSKFAAQLRQALGGSTCAGWDWDAHVDADRIRQSIDAP